MKKSFLAGVCVLAVANAYAATPETTTNAGETTAKVETVTPTAKKWSVSLLQETYVSAAAANTGEFDGTVADAFIGLGYSLSDTQSVTARQNFSMNQTDADETSEYALYDIALIYKNKAAYQVNNTPITQEFRLYLPVNENSRENGQVQARWGLAFDQTAAPKTTLSYANTMRFYTYADSAGQDGYRNYTSATATHEVNSIFSPYVELGHVARFRNSGAGVRGLDSDAAASNPDNVVSSAYLDLGANFAAGPLGITVYVDQDHDLRSGEQFVLGNEDELTYSMILTAAM